MKNTCLRIILRSACEVLLCSGILASAQELIPEYDGAGPWDETLVSIIEDCGTRNQIASVLTTCESLAFNGQPRACLELGKYYLDRDTPNRNPRKALALLNRAYLAGEEEAESLLSLIRKTGEAGAAGLVNIKEVIEKARSGVAREQFNLGFYLYEGIIVDKDVEFALGWYEKAAMQGMSAACYRLGDLHDHGAPDIERNPRVAAHWYKKAVENGNSLACTALADLYLSGEGVSKDFDRAKALYELAIERGNAVGYVGLGIMYRDGLGVSTDYTLAEELLQKANFYGCSGAETNLALLYIYALGKDRDLQKAYSLLEASANKGCPHACLAMGDFLQSGYWTGEIEVPYDEDRALQYYRSAARGRNAKAHLKLAEALIRRSTTGKSDYIEIAEHLVWAEAFSNSNDIYQNIRLFIANNRIATEYGIAKIVLENRGKRPNVRWESLRP